MRLTRLVAIPFLAAGIAGLGACDFEGWPAPSDSDPAAPGKSFDWERGRFERVGLGDSPARVIRAWGRPGRRGSTQPLEPTGADFYDIGGLTNVREPRIRTPGAAENLRYERHVVQVVGRSVTTLGTTDERARTPEGVGIGDDQDLVKEHYPNARCYIQYEGTEYPEYPICKVRVCKGRLLAFGGDPVKSIWLAAETRAGLRSCRRP